MCLTIFVQCKTIAQQTSPAKEVTVESLQKLYWQAKGFACGECSGTGKKTCGACNGQDKTQQSCLSCHGLDQTKTACFSCNGVDQTKVACYACKGVDQTKVACFSCNGVDQTKTSCFACSGSGKGFNGNRCFSCSGSGKSKACYFCKGSGFNKVCYSCKGRGFNNPCYSCKGVGRNKACFTCGGNGKQKPCYSCHGQPVLGGACETCTGEGSVEIVFAVHKTADELIVALTKYVAEEETKRDVSTVLKRDDSSRYVAENGSYYGELSNDANGPKVVFVDGYFRKDGTYVQSHYRSLPIGGTNARGPPLRVYSPTETTYSPKYAENGSYYGQLNSWGARKSVHVGSYFRKDGTYVQGHYRSRPRR